MEQQLIEEALRRAGTLMRELTRLEDRFVQRGKAASATDEQLRLLAQNANREATEIAKNAEEVIKHLTPVESTVVGN